MTDDIRDAAISVEAKLAGHSKRMDGGLNLRFQVHPNDISPELRDAEIGTRYLIALVQLNDQEEPVAPRKTKPEHRLATRAAILCKDPLFQMFLRNVWSMPDCIDEESTANALRVMWGIESRRELVPGSQAAEQFDHLLTHWIAWKRAEEEDMEFTRKYEAGKVLTAPDGPVGDFEEGMATTVADDHPNAPAASPGPAKGIQDLVKGAPE